MVVWDGELLDMNEGDDSISLDEKMRTRESRQTKSSQEHYVVARPLQFRPECKFFVYLRIFLIQYQISIYKKKRDLC